MHSSRMRTGRALTVSGGMCVYPSRIFGGGERNWKKKEKKIQTRPPPGSRHPPWEQTLPPGADTLPQSRHPPPRHV